MRTAFKTNPVIHADIRPGKKVITYTCPRCGYYNEHVWLGREDHFCSRCDEATNLKGGI